MRKYWLYVWLILVVANCNSSEQDKSYDEFQGYPISLTYLIDSLGIDNEELSLKIDKSTYTLQVVHQTKIIREYPVVFGRNPVDDKLMEGDRCTPEGIFKIRDLYPHKSWSKFIWIDYPTADSWRKHREAKAKGQIPEEATIGGEIGIHGVPANQPNLIDRKKNWTWGCISLTNEDIDDLYKIAYEGMNVEIVNYLE